MKTRRFNWAALFVVACLIAVLAPILMAGTVTEPTVFRDRVMFRGSTGPDFDADNSFSIGGVKVTATAAELNGATTNTVSGLMTNAVAATALTFQRAVNLAVTNIVPITEVQGDYTNVVGITLQYEAVKAVTNATAATTITPQVMP